MSDPNKQTVVSIAVPAAREAGKIRRTPGLVVASHDLLARNAYPTDAEIREALAGNLCRCTGYEKILDAVRLAAGRLA